MNKLLQILPRATNLLIGVSLIALAIAHFKKGQFPSVDEIGTQSYRSPQQIAPDEEEFSFDYHGTEYVIEPVAKYSISGLVVSHNDILGFTDIYHDESSVDIKDLCVVWGENLKSDVYQRMIYWSEPWTCYMQSPDRETWEEFNPDQLSNNHLLSPNSQVRETIQSVRLGDQITMSGLLVNYYPAEHPDYKRETSTVRTDTGNGACEVMLVDEIEIHRQATPIWYAVYGVSKMGLIGLLVLKLGLFLFLPYRHYARSG